MAFKEHCFHYVMERSLNLNVKTNEKFKLKGLFSEAIDFSLY